MNGGALTEIDLPLPRFYEKGKTKVREVFDVSEIAPRTLLIVATDRVSAYDVVFLNGIPGKGKVLTKISAYWFRATRNICPNHFITDNFNEFPEKLRKILQPYKRDLKDRTMLVVKIAKDDKINVECVVRGNLLGSAHDSYQETGQICGIQLPLRLKKGDKLPAPIFTPAYKAPRGEHDENITFERMIEIVGLETAQLLRAYSMSLYCYMANLSSLKGVGIPDTKYEFGWLTFQKGKIIIQTDESGTPDSSRYEPDYSKQPLRDFLNSIGFDKKTPIELPADVVKKTSAEYIKGCQIITGQSVNFF